MSETRKLLFETEGAPSRQGLFKKLRNRASVFDSGIRVELAGNIYDCALEDIFDVYVKEPATPDVNARTAVIEFYREGKPRFLELSDETFPGLAEKTEHVLQNEWSRLLKKRDYPDTVKWFVACCAVVYISSGQNPHIFGSAYKHPETAFSQREVLRNSWGFDDASDLRRMLPKLMNGRSVAQWSAFAAEPDALDADGRALYDAIMADGGEICFWAWDWQRLIFISSLGYLCEWLSYEESLSWCLAAGQKLRGMFQSWDEFMRCYLSGYCFWAQEDPDDGDGETAARRRIYEYYKKLPQNPWSAPWDLSLQREWTDASGEINEARMKLPADFTFLPEMYADGYFPDFLVDKLRDQLLEIVAFIEEGGHTAHELQVILDCVIQKTNESAEEFEENGSEIETAARDSIASTVANILRYFGVDIDIETAIRMREW